MKRIALYAALLTALWGAMPAYADGFHYDIDVTSELELDNEGKVMGVRQVWDYAPEITNIMLESMDVISDQSLDELGLDMMKDLKKLGYFVDFRVDGADINHSEVEDYDILLPSEKQLELQMFHPFAEPVDIKGKRLVIDMADPDGTGILRHASAASVNLPDALKSQCRVSLEKKQDPNNAATYVHGDPVQLVTIDCT
ncbi:DUF1007 family protein [Thiofilum flexile]|uniref:DUF1007 family protein n=1 Tax=Thiofilum flexile TaxID=125627 RepID=UPI00035F906F|nr:DUF1007 family protein [Thiofilum flexile]